MRRRAFLLWVVSALALAAIWVRAFHVQVISHSRFVEEAAAARSREWEVEGPRGPILDADGNLLATDRAAVRLVFVPGEWATRERFRCSECGVVVTRPSPRWSGSGSLVLAESREGDEKPIREPRRCSCGAAGARFERMPDENLAPLEDAMGLPSGTLLAAAAERMKDVCEEVEAEVVDGVLQLPPGTVRAERRRRSGETGRSVPIAEVLATYAPELDGREFYVEDLRRQRRADLFARPVPLQQFRTPSGARVDVRSLSPAAERLIELDRDGRYRGFRAEPFTQRWYPRHALLSQCVGIVTPFRTAEEYRDFRRRFGEGAVLPDTRIGRLGLEAAYDDALRGGVGRVRAVRDDDGIFSIRTVVATPRRGDDVVLSLTADASQKALECLTGAATDDGFGGTGPASGAFVVMDAATGAILAWAETPMFDPNESVEAVSTKTDEEEAVLGIAESAGADPLAADPPGARAARPTPPVTLSKVARIAVEAGSSMKPVTVYTLLVSGHPVPEEYHCAGPERGVEPRYPKCHSHGPVGPEGTLTVSCNRWCADCASNPLYRALHVHLFPEWAARFGIGAPTGVDFPREGRGRYPKKVDGPILRQLSIGQSMLATPLQMARVAAGLATGGSLPVPRIASSVGGRPVEPISIPIELDPHALARVRAGMRGCVETGTAHGKFDLPGLSGVSLFGKTGTATATGPDWVAADDIDPSDGPWHLWFVGYAQKAGSQTLAFAMVLHDRKSGDGGKEAAPAVARFLAWWFSERDGERAAREQARRAEAAAREARAVGPTPARNEMPVAREREAPSSVSSPSAAPVDDGHRVPQAERVDPEAGTR